MKKVVVWNPKFVPSYIDTYSPSWRKPRAFMRSMAGNILDSGVSAESSVSAEDMLHRVHSIAHVDAILSGKKPNGFGSNDKEASKSCLYTCGGMVRGVELAHQGVSSCVPVSGFHHAGMTSVAGSAPSMALL